MKIQVFTGNSMRTVLTELLPQFERDSGRQVSVSYDPAQIVLKRIANGESADLAFLGEPAIDKLIQQGKIAAASKRALARLGAGVAVRAGAPHPDIGSVEAFKRMLLDAKTIAYASEGASGIHFAGLIERLGIAAQIKSKARTRPGGLVGELVVSGEAEIALQQIPELMAVPGIDVVGPFPAELQKISVTTAGIFAASRQSEAAQALLDFLTAPAAARVFRAKGLEPLF